MTENLTQDLFHTGLGVYIVVFFGAAFVGACQLILKKQRPDITDLAVLGLISLIFIPTVIQLFFWPDLLTWLRRDTAEIVHHLQPWRLLTAVTVQGGAFGGAVLNLVSLVLLAPICGRLYGGKRMWLCFLIGTIAGELAGLVLLPVGAGNSVGNFGVAALILVGAIRYTRGWLRIIAAGILALGLFSLTWLDIHGFALAAGSITAVYLISKRRLLGGVVR
ncbi:MAG: rhomboid family intrarane serine protease [Candidatus Saccharibacteria bacterium]|nr:rhomboid family intrarane serine protease [Candidatus Saccharibacteria bacterium]